jgi:diguanylate cyclase (GGDEF)-like protein
MFPRQRTPPGMFRKKLYVVVALILLMVTGFLATSLLSYFVARDSIASQISDQALPLTSDNIYSEIQRDLLRTVLISSLMSADTFLRDWLLAGEQDSETVRQYLADIQEKYATITAFLVSDRTLNYYHSTGILRQVNLADPDDAWYARTRGLHEPYEINIDNDTYDRSQLNIFINYRVLDYNGNFIGVTGVGLAVNAATQLINNYQQRYGRTIDFVDRQGNITLTGNTGIEMMERRLQERPGLGALAAQILSSPSANLSYRNQADTKAYLNSRLVPEFDWYLVVEQDASDAAGRIQDTLWINTGLALGIMALVLFAAHFTLRTWQNQLEAMATTDRLTGLGNRHLFEVLFEQACKRVTREDRPMSLLVFDIDNFKVVNDTWGHHGGDIALQKVAELAKQHVRVSDVICRWGGEEFLILLDNCDLEEATTRAQEICDAARALHIPYGREHIQLTLSCGVTRYQSGESLAAVATRADSALYEAKGCGRDQVCVALTQ